MSRKRRGLVVAGALTLAEALVVGRRRGSLLSADTVVRCRRGHVFTTTWIPGISLKAVRLGWWRLQRCPVGHHWSLVTPVRTTDLSPAQRLLAARRHDVPLP
jgi:hypothetical protein